MQSLHSNALSSQGICRESTGFRSSASFGKRQEFVVITELLRREFDVYLTLVDDQQIDCVVPQEIDGKPVYMDIQIKARSKNWSRRLLDPPSLDAESRELTPKALAAAQRLGTRPTRATPG
jgi:predicted AAA+ superfamily ATPase